MNTTDDLSTLLAEVDAHHLTLNRDELEVRYDGRTFIVHLADDPSWGLPKSAAHGIVALVNAYPALREAIEQAIKTQQHMDETLRPLVEELRKDAHQARARETEACAEAARLRTECDEQAAIASNAVTKGAAYALENERLRALVAQQREECDEARARAIRWNNEHATAEDRWVEERDALRAEVLQLRKNLLRTWAAAEVREYDLRKLVAQQREALRSVLRMAEEWREYGRIPRSCGACGTPLAACDTDCMAAAYDSSDIAKVRAVLAQEVPS